MTRLPDVQPRTAEQAKALTLRKLELAKLSLEAGDGVPENFGHWPSCGLCVFYGPRSCQRCPWFRKYGTACNEDPDFDDPTVEGLGRLIAKVKAL